MEHMQKVTNINHVKFDIHTLDNMEVTHTFMFNLHIQTVSTVRTVFYFALTEGKRSKRQRTQIISFISQLCCEINL